MNKEHKEVQINPRLYIVQPRFEPTVINIQKSFVYKGTKREEKKPADKRENVRSHYDLEKKQNALENKEELIIPNDSNDQASIDQFPSKRKTNQLSKKPFYKMNIKEKINFLLYKPAYIPAVNCLVKTKNKAVVGRVVSESENDIEIVSNKKGGSIKIDKSSIISIDIVLG